MEKEAAVLRKYLPLLLAALIAVLPAAGTVSRARAAGNELTVLVYLCGADLESENGQATDDIREMISSGIGDSGSVSVLLATGGSPEWQRYGISGRSVQYYRLGAGAPVLLEDAGRRSMGSADTLSGFLEYAFDAAPADRYILILWDHGGGPVFGLCSDRNFSDDSLSLSELRTGLINGLHGNRLDVIGFDCCLMNCLDLCSDLYGIADYAVLSQEMVSGTGLDYDAWMRPVADNPALPSEEIAVSMAETYVAENSRGRNACTATMSVIALDKMPAVVAAADAFSASLSSEMRSNLSGVVRLRTRLTSFGEFLDSDASDLVDVECMCDVFSALLPRESRDLKEAAAGAVYYNGATDDIASSAHGLSFFMPYATVSGDSRDILDHYGARTGSYAALAVDMTGMVSSSGYAMAASSYTPSSFYYHDDYAGDGSGASGSLCDIWNGYYGDSCSFDDALDSCGGDIWAGLNASSGSVWEGYSSSSGIWAGWQPGSPSSAETPAPSAENIWAGLPEQTEEPSGTPVPSSASAAVNNIWAGLLNAGPDYYQPGEANPNVQEGVSEAVPAEGVLEAAGAYFSSAVLSSQIVYSVQLNKTDLDHLSAADGVLSVRDGDETIRLGNLGETTVDWSTGLVFSMFDGSWPMLDGRMVRAEFLYGDEAGNTRFVIPARVNGLKMYLLGSRSAGGETELLGATQGYDENGFAIRGFIPLEPGMTVSPLFTAVSPDGTEREYEDGAVVVPADGLTLTWGRIPEGRYLYSFGLTDLSGRVHYTDSVELSF